MNNITLPQLPWHATSELKLSLPDQWKATYYSMAGAEQVALKPDEIQSAIACPIGSPPIRQLARNKKEVVIIFDDMTRVTRTAEIVPFVLEELAAAGISDKNIRFVCALGSHGAHNRLDFEKKLGATVLTRFPVYNHNAFSQGTYVGTTSRYKTKVYINEEVMKCDFKIAIGMVAPHPATGFGGGGKIILPGVASGATIEHNHRMAIQDAIKHQDHPIIGMGNYDNNPARMDIEEAATMAGLDMLINCMVNQWGETVSVFAGALLPTFTEAVCKAKEHYLTPMSKNEDIIIANTFAKASEAIAVGLNSAFSAAGRKGSSVVLIANAPEGQVTHYLLGTFGRHTSGAISMRVKIPDNIDRVLVYSEYADVAGRDYIEETEKVFFMNKWDDVLAVLKGSVKGNASVAVYPAADIQYTKPSVR
jgi:nickel-dependent lactate racemase